MGADISTGCLDAFNLTELITPNDLSLHCEIYASHLPRFGLNSEKCESANREIDLSLSQFV